MNMAVLAWGLVVGFAGLLTLSILGMRAWKERFGALHNKYTDELAFRGAFVDQARVDEALTKLAIDFSDACLEQIKSQQISPENYERTLLNIEDAVKGKKNLFWGPRNLAKKLGYQVREKFSDYLPSEERS